MCICSVKGCGIAGADMLALIDDGSSLLLLCAHHRALFANGGLDARHLLLLKSMFACGACELCSLQGILYVDEMQLVLCRSHLEKLLSYRLRPEEYRQLYGKYGQFALISAQFYSPWGIALQPRRSHSRDVAQHS